MKTRIVKIGNSCGIRLPKPLIEEAGLGEDVALRVVAAGLLIERAAQTREGWAEAAARLRARGEDGLLDEAWPVHSAGGWPEDLSLDRAGIYEDRA